MTDLASLNFSDYPIFDDNITTIKETSLDKKAATYMTESALPAINFDGVKNDYIKTLSLQDIPRSNDALIKTGKGKLVFIEFKNGLVDTSKQFGLRKKIYDSVFIFSDIVDVGISAMRKSVDYILVYNESANPTIVEDKRKFVQPSASFDSLVKGISGLAKKEYIAFGLGFFKNYCFAEVHTYSQEEFNSFLETI